MQVSLQVLSYIDVHMEVDSHLHNQSLWVAYWVRYAGRQKSGLDPDDFNNYRPISYHLYQKSFRGYWHLRSRITWNTIISLSHSTPCISPEIALVKITKNLIDAADSGLLSILILLNLSATFSTISHQLLMDRLASIGVCGPVNQWVVHYLANRTQFCVQIHNYRKLDTES